MSKALFKVQVRTLERGRDVRTDRMLFSGMLSRSPVLHLATLLTSFSTLMSAAPDYSPAFAQLNAAVKAEMEEYRIGGIAMALTDCQNLIYSAGYGEAKFDSVFRAGSISKLFNAVAVLQQVEAGKLDLDAPFATLPGAVALENPFNQAGQITLRQILCHRSGIQREAPVGGYFDTTQPSLAATCESVGGCRVVTPPNAKTRYSNIAPSLAGQVVATVSGRSFEAYQQEHLLVPMGMKHSAWRLRDVPPEKLIVSHLRVADGRGSFTHEQAPVFDLGTVPAGNLYSTAPDLAEFIIMLDAKGKGPHGRILKSDTLAEMTTPQLDPSSGFGLGFALGKLGDHEAIGHSGAVYGHSTALLYLPKSRLGVVVLANEDIVNARVSKLANLALSLLLEIKTGERRSPSPQALSVPAKALHAYAGRWESQSFWAEFSVSDGHLAGNFASQPCVLTPTAADTFLLNSRIHDDVPVPFVRDDAGVVTGFTLGVQKFHRIAAKPVEFPHDWRPFLGSYGPRIIPLVIHEKWGHLYATTENMVDYRLTPASLNTFNLPPGMYDDEQVAFLADKSGVIPSVRFASMILPRSAP